MPEQQNFHEEFSLRILPACDIQNTVHIGDECPIKINQSIQVMLRLYFQHVMQALFFTRESHFRYEGCGQKS
jgi:hypothetical protein